MPELNAGIGDTGERTSTGGRRPARYHLVATNTHDKYPYRRSPGQALCNPNLGFPVPELLDHPEDVSCGACLARAERHNIRIVTPGGDTPTT